MEKREKEDDTFLRKKHRKKIKQCYHVDICRGKWNSFSREGEITMEIFWINKSKKKKKKKKLMNLIKKNHHINKTSDHSGSTNNLFRSHLNAKSFKKFLALQQLGEARWFCFSVYCKVLWTCKGDVNSASWKSCKESSSSTISAEFCWQ